MKYAFVDFRISSLEQSNLEKLGCDVIVCPPSFLLYKAICGHPDILLHFIDSKNIVLHRDIENNFKAKLSDMGFITSLSKSSLCNNYPKDIILNAVNTKDLFVHNLKYTDETLLNSISQKKISVNQGYTKCSTVILNDNLFITSDKTIYEALINEKKEVLLLPPGHISLPGLNYGFIGGTCGMFNDNTLVLYGNLNKYYYGELVLDFLYKNNISPIFLNNDTLIDRGSIFFLDSPNK